MDSMQKETLITENDLATLLHFLNKHSSEWNEIGLSLGFLISELKTISAKQLLLPKAPGSFLQELLSQWVQWPTASHPTKPTLEAMCAALRSSLVGLGSLADKVNKEIMRQRKELSLEEQLSKFPCQLLDHECVESHLGKLVHVIDSETIMMIVSDLDLPQVEVDDIQISWESRLPKQRLETFKTLLKSSKSLFTYRKLITVLHEVERWDAIDILYKLISALPQQPSKECTFDKESLARYGEYLKERCVEAHTVAASNKWLPSPTRKFFNLAIIKKERIQHGKIDDKFIQQSIHGQIDDILLDTSRISLKNIFENIKGQRKVVLITGCAGSGKSTLVSHICQKWGRGDLFQEYIIVILVQLRDPVVQNAKSIADLLPCSDNESAHLVATAIKARHGKGILWILDGWDELPSQLRVRSFLREVIIPSKVSSTSLSSVIVTSRPISSDDLSEFVSSRVEVLGFTSEEQRLYFTECLNGDTKAVDTLLERLSDNPAIEGSCFLPLNASIVAHLYLSDGSLPNTVYDIFASFIQHFLSRYLYEKLSRTQECSHIESLNTLPQELRCAFFEMCKLAFHGTVENKVTFSHSEIKAAKDSAIICDLGLLQATPSIVSDGKTLYFNFIHLSVQEFLSAVYISRMPAHKQVDIFDSLFEDSRFSSVFRYYAAITKLRTSIPFIHKLPKWMCPIPAGILDLVTKIVRKGKLVYYYEPKHLLVALLNCLHEAQDRSLCKFVVELLKFELDLSNTSLTPVDCFSVGYFLSNLSRSTIKNNFFKVKLISCGLGDAGTKSLVQSVCKYVQPHDVVNYKLELNLGNNNIKDSASHVADLIKSGCILNSLVLDVNHLGDKGAQTVFDTLGQNKTLRYLSISNCEITDIGVASLAKALNTNNTLEVVKFHNNDAVTNNGLSHLVEVISQKSCLIKLLIPNCLAVYKARKTINEERQKCGLAAIRINGWY